MTTAAFAGLDPCVHCGFCLPACPTYEATLDECDSPRGRIVLMRALERGEAPADDPALTWHLDRCLGCRACESACPSGVSYGPAIEAARVRIAAVRHDPAALDAALWILARPARQRLAWWASRVARGTGLPAALARGAGEDAPALIQMLAMLAATRPSDRRTAAPPHQVPLPGIPGYHGRAAARAAPTRRRTRKPDAEAALFRGCVMDGLFGHVHGATVRTLAVNGVATVEVRRQVCCGALAAHAGREGLARELARENVRAFDAAAPGATVVTDSAGCGAALKAYGEWLAGDPLEDRARAFAARVRDASEVLAERGPEPADPLPLRVAYDAPCHLHHAQRVTTEPLRLLAAIPGLEVVPLEGADRCCGSAGLYSLLETELSRAVLAPKLRAIADSGAGVVATGNPGCLMQIGAGLLLAGMDVEVRHPVELLDLAYRR
jgi:glycolate oxidase iron-sulfur subunit